MVWYVTDYPIIGVIEQYSWNFTANDRYLPLNPSLQVTLLLSIPL
jgi:hypothetical protein